MSIIVNTLPRKNSLESPAENFALVLANLKLVNDINEGVRLHQIIESGKISSTHDEDLIRSTGSRWENVLSEKYRNERSFPKDSEAVFKLLTRLLGIHGYTNKGDLTAVDWLGHQFFCCFGLTAKLGWRHHLTKDNPLCLSFNVHRDALQACVKILEDRDAHPGAKRSVIETLAYIINHPAMSEAEQLNGLSLLKKYGRSHELIDCLRDCVVLEHATPMLQKQASDLIFSIAQNEKCDLKDRKDAIKYLPFLVAYTNVIERVRSNSVEVLCDLIRDESGDLSLRKLAMEKLSLWMWSLDKGQFQQHRYAFEILKDQLRTKDIKLFSALVQQYLFHGIWQEDQKKPMVMALLPILKGMLSAKKIPLAFKLSLAALLPKASRYVVLSENAMPLFRFMVEEIQKRDVPIELKEVYVENIMGFFCYDATRKLIRKEFSDFISIDSILEFECIKNDPTLLSVAKKAKGSCLALAKQLGSEWVRIPGSELGIFFPSSYRKI